MGSHTCRAVVVAAVGDVERARRVERRPNLVERGAARRARLDVRFHRRPRSCLGVVEGVGDELFLGDVGHAHVLTNGLSARRILATARKMLCRVAAAFCPRASAIASIGCCSRWRSVNAARSSGVRSAIAASSRVAQLAALRLALRAGLRRGQAFNQRRRVLIVVADRLARPLAQQVDGAIGGDAVQPRAQARSGLEPRQLRVRLQECVLDDVLGVLLVAGDPVGDAEDSATVPLDERPKRVAVAGPGLGQDEGLGAVHHSKTLDGQRVARPLARAPGSGRGPRRRGSRG